MCPHTTTRETEVTFRGVQARPARKSTVLRARGGLCRNREERRFPQPGILWSRVPLPAAQPPPCGVRRHCGGRHRCAGLERRPTPTWGLREGRLSPPDTARPPALRLAPSRLVPACGGQTWPLSLPPESLSPCPGSFLLAHPPLPEMMRFLAHRHVTPGRR